jgi:hypothetical protein
VTLAGAADTYLAYPVLHELRMGLKNKQEIRALTQWRERFIPFLLLILTLSISANIHKR